MKKNYKNIFESNDQKSKQIIQTTIINSPRIISSKNHVIIKQYITTKEPEPISNENYLYKKNIKAENKPLYFRDKIFNDKSKVLNKQQDLNLNNNGNGNSKILNSTITIFKRNKNLLNNNYINNNNKTNYKSNQNIKIIEIKKPNAKIVEEYHNIHPKKNFNVINNNKNINLKENENKLFPRPIKTNVKFLKNFVYNRNLDNYIEEFPHENTEKNIISPINYEIDKEKSKTFDNLGNKKFQKNIYNYKNYNNNQINKNNYVESIKANTSERRLYIKKYPFQKQVVKYNDSIKKSSSKLYESLNDLNIKNKIKIEEVNDEPIPEANNHMLKSSNNVLDIIKEYKNNKTCKKIVLIEKNKEKEENNINNDIFQHSKIGENISSPMLGTELNNISDNLKVNGSYSISSFRNLKKNRSLPKTSFRFLINKASEDKQFGESFHKAYQKNKNTSIEKSIEKIKSKNESLINEQSITSRSNNIKSYKNKTLENTPKIFDYKHIFNDKSNKALLMNNLSIIKNQKNEELRNKNQLNRTSNNFKSSSRINSNNLNLTKNKSNDNIFESNSNQQKFDNEENEENNDFVIVSSVEPKKQISPINIELLYNFENKILALIYKIKKYQKFEDESFDIINFYFQNDISKYIIELFNGVYYKNIIISYIKTELLSYFLSYDICFSNRLEQVILLIKSIINLIHNNFLLLIMYIIKCYKRDIITFSANTKNQTIIYYLENIIKQNIITEISNDELNEGNIIKMIMKNVIEVNKYYKLITDNIYQREYLNEKEIENSIKFPYCLKYINNFNDNKEIDIFKNKKQIISLFFIESYQLLNNYSIFDLENFFYSFLYKANNNFNNNAQFILPKIDNSRYKYTLVLDLDETLVHCDRKSITGFLLILRPGLIEFLQRMKSICELILFSFGTSNYIDSIIKVIEKKEKFFEYILDRNHGIYENGDCIKNLDILNRDLKNVIIIDDTSKFFKLHQENGICIKPFFGDIENDKNTLVILGNILEKIFYDANNSGDVRKSLKKYKKLLIYSNIINN